MKVTYNKFNFDEEEFGIIGYQNAANIVDFDKCDAMSDEDLEEGVCKLQELEISGVISNAEVTRRTKFIKMFTELQRERDGLEYKNSWFKSLPFSNIILSLFTFLQNQATSVRSFFKFF